MQADRRRLNAPAGGTTPPVFAALQDVSVETRKRIRAPDEHRKIFLRTGVVPSAAGSAYYELAPSGRDKTLMIPSSANLKISCTVHGPRPLARNAAFSPNLLLTTHVKFAPFASRERRGYVRDSVERDLGAHLETALRGVIIGERLPKSGCEIAVTILEGEQDGGRLGATSGEGWAIMNVLAGCITAASAALADAGIDCVDLVSGGVAAVAGDQCLLDPSPVESAIQAACVVGYLQNRDEITEIWIKGETSVQSEALIDEAVKAATLTRTVLVDAIEEATVLQLQHHEEGGAPAITTSEKADHGTNV